MTHDELRDRLLDLACGELSPREAREVEEHAASCDACRAELARMRGTRQAMSALPVEPAPARGEAILLAAARESSERRKAQRRPFRWLWRGALVAVPVAAVVAVSIRIAGVSPREQSGRDALLGGSTVARVEPQARREESPPAASAAPPSAAADMAPRRAMAKAAPAPAPAMGAAEAAGSPRQRAIEAAVAHAARLSYDTRTTRAEAGDAPVGWDAWLAANPQVRSGGGPSASPALEGRRFWVVRFRPASPRAEGGGLTVFVEDDSFRVLGELRGQ
jgi:hypothetical protein